MRGHPARFTRLTVYLRPDGTFRVVHHADLADLDQFRLALHRHHRTERSTTDAIPTEIIPGS